MFWCQILLAEARSVTFGGSGGIRCPPVGGRAHVWTQLQQKEYTSESCRLMTERGVREQELMHESKQQPASESLEQRWLPGGQNKYLLPRVRELPRVRRSLGAKVAARERGALSGPGSLPKRARIAEAARDAETSETCKRLCYCQRGWQGNAKYCRLEEGCLLLCGSPGEA